MRLPTFLITSFEPFGGRLVNSSERFLISADREALSQEFQCVIEHRSLPVSWKRTSKELSSVMDQLRPQFVFSFGEASSKSFRIECLAQNLCEGRILDNDKEEAPAERIVLGGVESVQSKFLTHKLLDQLKAKSWKICESQDAGKFLCNFVYYHLLTSQDLDPSRALFVHVPVDWEINVLNRESAKQLSTQMLREIIQLALSDTRSDA